MNTVSQNDVCSQGPKTTEQETSEKGLILKELTSYHISRKLLSRKYEFLEQGKRKPVIISAALT